MSKKLTLSDIKRHIRKCKKNGWNYTFLGLVENRDLTPEVEALFTLTTYEGATVYDWVKGNKLMEKLPVPRSKVWS